MGNQAQWPLARMAAQTERLDFSPKHVLTMLELMGVAAFGSAQGPGADLVRVMSPEELLGACAGRLDSANPERLGTEIKLLRRQPGQPTPEERAKYRRLIFEHRLLRKDLPVSKSLTAEFYDVLLRLSFGAPLTYANYCDIEDCVGCAGQQLHKSLLQAIDQVGFADLSPQLLVHNGLDEKRQREALRSGWVPSTSLVAVAADRQLRVPHARIICDLAVRVLREWSGPPDWEAVRVALRRRGYLAPVLQQRHHDEPQYQADVLAGLLQAVYGRKLDRPAVAEIMGNIDFAPTAALLAAVVTLADPADAGLAVWEHARSLLFNTNFDDRTGRHLRNLLQGHDQSADGPRTARPPRISPSFSGVGSRWLARAVLPHSRGAEVRPGKEETPPPR
jgi:hypothetical protein